MDGTWDRIAGNWKQFWGNVKQEWGDLTDDDLTYIDGQRERLEGKVQERYGIAKDDAHSRVSNWLDRLALGDDQKARF